jgi:hypothetical protein
MRFWVLLERDLLVIKAKIKEILQELEKKGEVVNYDKLLFIEIFN